MTENFPGLVKDISLQIQETQWTPPNRKNTEKIVNQTCHNQTAKNQRWKEWKQADFKRCYITQMENVI